MATTHPLPPQGEVPTGERAIRDRRATPLELAATRRFVLGVDGPGIAQAAERLGVSAGYLSELLKGKRRRRLLVSELRRLRLTDTAEGRPVSHLTPPRSPASPPPRALRGPTVLVPPRRPRREEVAI